MKAAKTADAPQMVTVNVDGRQGPACEVHPAAEKLQRALDAAGVSRALLQRDSGIPCSGQTRFFQGKASLPMVYAEALIARLGMSAVVGAGVRRAGDRVYLYGTDIYGRACDRAPVVRPDAATLEAERLRKIAALEKAIAKHEKTVERHRQALARLTEKKNPARLSA